MGRQRDEDSKDVKVGTVIKHNLNGKLVTDRYKVLQVWEYFKTLLNQREKRVVIIMQSGYVKHKKYRHLSSTQ